MGYNTPVLILNDALRDIERNPEEFVSGLVRACEMPMFTGHEDIAVGSRLNAAQVLMHRHADEHRVLVSQGNWLWEVRADHDPYIDRVLAGDDFLRNVLLTRARECHAAANRVQDVLSP